MRRGFMYGIAYGLTPTELRLAFGCRLDLSIWTIRYLFSVRDNHHVLSMTKQALKPTNKNKKDPGLHS